MGFRGALGIFAAILQLMNLKDLRPIFMLMALTTIGCAGVVPLSPDSGNGPQPDLSPNPLVDAPAVAPTDSQTTPSGDATHADQSTGCSEPTPFAPGGQPSDWRHTSTKLFTVTAGSANHRGQDVIAEEGSQPVLIGKFAYGLVDKDLKDEDVEIYIQPSPPCGEWQLLGTAATSEDGQYGTTYGIEDDGGRIFYTLPKSLALGVGRYGIRMRAKGDHSIAAFTLFIVKTGTHVVVSDIDGTLTTGDFELITQLFSEIFNGTYAPKAYAGGKEMLEAWVAKGYLPVYLTARPDSLKPMTRQWLVDQGYPPGALHLTDSNSQAVPGSSGVGKYKSDYLMGLKTISKVELYAAYGNASTDIEAFEFALISKTRTFIIGSNAGNANTTPITDYPSHLPTVKAMPAASIPAPSATFGW
jgi:hypothetical protein